ncbi:MAG: hypothetical protein IKP66_00610 [Lachnospiraceae bacterium]|nr:hypothetical protein [Lachnospiraceae bacterium]
MSIINTIAFAMTFVSIFTTAKYVGLSLRNTTIGMNSMIRVRVRAIIQFII